MRPWLGIINKNASSEDLLEGLQNVLIVEYCQRRGGTICQSRFSSMYISHMLKWCISCNASEFGQRCLRDIPCEGSCFFGNPWRLKDVIPRQVGWNWGARTSALNGQGTKWKMTILTCFVPGLLGTIWEIGIIRAAPHVLVIDNGFLTPLCLFSLRWYYIWARHPWPSDPWFPDDGYIGDEQVRLTKVSVFGGGREVGDEETSDGMRKMKTEDERSVLRRII